MGLVEGERRLGGGRREDYGKKGKRISKSFVVIVNMIVPRRPAAPWLLNRGGEEREGGRGRKRVPKRGASILSVDEDKNGRRMSHFENISPAFENFVQHSHDI